MTDFDTYRLKTTVNFQYIYHIASRVMKKSTNKEGSKRHCFSTHTTLVPLVKKYQHMLTTKISQNLKVEFCSVPL